MAKKPKKTPTTPPPADQPAASSEAVVAAVPRPTRPAAKGKKTGISTVKKAAAARTTKARPKTLHSAVPEPSDEEIRLRAYFIAERRHRFDLAGDASSDWIEARRQLLSEAVKR